MVNKVYQHDETAITWLSSTGTNVITLTSLAGNTGRQGARHDFGTTARAHIFAWRAWFVGASGVGVGEVTRLYWISSDGTSPDNDDGTGDANISDEDKLLNLRRIGTIIADEAATSVTFASSGLILLPHRYGHPVFWNQTGNTAYSATALDHGFSLTPVPPELQ